MSSITKPRLDPNPPSLSGERSGAGGRCSGISQADLGRPFTRGFVSAVEGGHCVPSLSALILLAYRLETTTAVLLAAVSPRLEDLYTPARAASQVARPPRYRAESPASALSVGARIRAARASMGMTQQQLAGERYTKAYISALENALVRPSVAALEYRRPASAQLPAH